MFDLNAQIHYYLINSPNHKTFGLTIHLLVIVYRSIQLTLLLSINGHTLEVVNVNVGTSVKNEQNACG